MSSGKSSMDRSESDREAAVISDMALSLLEKFKSSHDPQMLDRALQTIQSALEGTPEDDSRRPRRLNVLALILRTQYECFRNVEALTEAIETLQKATSIPADNSILEQIWRNLRVCLEYRYNESGESDAGDLEAAVHASVNAVKYCQDPKALSENYNNLSEIRRRLFEYCGDESVLDMAIDDAKQAVARATNDDPYRSVYEHNLGIAFKAKWDLGKSQVSALDDIIACRKRCLELPCPHPQYRQLFQNSYAISLRVRFSVKGDINDLNEATLQYKNILEISNISVRDEIMYRNNLGIALLDKYRRLGNLDDLNTGIKEINDALNKARLSNNIRDQTMCLSNISILLGTRFEATGANADLTKALECARDAVSLEMMNPRSPRISSRILNYGNALKMKYLLSEEPSDLDLAIEQYNEAIKYCPERSRQYIHVANNLAACYRLRYEHSQELDSNDLDHALTWQHLVELLANEHSSITPKYFNNMARALLARYIRDGKEEDLSNAIVYARDAVQRTDTREGVMCAYSENLAELLLHTYRLNEDPRDLTEAVELYTAGVNVESAPATLRIETGQRGATLLEGMGRMKEAYRLLRLCVELLPETGTRASDFVDQQRRLTSLTGLASDAAALALNCGEPPEIAAQLLEAGRGVILGRLLDLRTEVSGLPKTLEDEYKRLKSVLDPPFQYDMSPLLQQPNYVDMAHRAASDMKTLRNRIREIDGFQDFERPISVAQMKAQATAEQPIVLINVNERRCDAFLFIGDKVLHLLLKTALDDIESLISVFRETIDKLTTSEIGK